MVFIYCLFIKLESDEWIIGRLEVILGQVRQNTAILQQLLSQGRSAAPVLSHEAIETFGFPLETMADITRVETLLRDRENNKILVHCIEIVISHLYVYTRLKSVMKN